MSNTIQFIKDGYKNNQSSSFFICSEHGEFSIQKSRVNLYDIKCAKCRRKIKLQEKITKEIELIKSLGPKIHSNFDYSKIKYDYSKKKYVVECKKHGEVYITYNSHIKLKHQCKKCSEENKKYISKKLLERSKKYDFEIISKNKKKVTIKCKKHGVYTTYANRLVNGCHKCYSEKSKSTLYKNILENLNKNIEDLSKVKVIDIKDSLNITILCYKHKIIENVSASNFRRTYSCPKCTEIGVSYAEKEIANLVPNSTLNTKRIITPYELDIFSKKYNFAIEYNGLMWHSFGIHKSDKFNNTMLEKIHKYNHLQKTELCEKKGIQLFHIFENEWLDPIKQKIWKSMINAKINTTNRIYARKCHIKEIDNKECMIFLENNHIQGKINAKIKLGLYYNEKLVQVMTFRTPTQKKYKGQNNYELSRLCSLKNITVVGGASKLLKYFERNYNPSLIISYANRRWSINIKSNVYNVLGFKFQGYSAINYFYFNNDRVLESRNKFQKHKLKNILNNFNENLSETENMYNNNYRKIYDSGNMIFIKSY